MRISGSLELPPQLQAARADYNPILVGNSDYAISGFVGGNMAGYFRYLFLGHGFTIQK